MGDEASLPSSTCYDAEALLLITLGVIRLKGRSFFVGQCSVTIPFVLIDLGSQLVRQVLIVETGDGYAQESGNDFH